LNWTGKSSRSKRGIKEEKRKGEDMDEGMTKQLAATAERLATAAETLDRVLAKLDSQQEALNVKVDRIVAAVEERAVNEGDPDRARKLEQRVAELEKANTELKAQALRMTRKTLSPLVTAVLSKSGAESGERLDPAVVDKTLQSLSVEQRIAVKAEMARAGMIE
jgi:predicted RNase H-like nuclease (RuvC/YqgF family)